MRSLYFDRQGNPITMEQWASGRSGRSGHIERRVAGDALPDGTWVSTVWLGLDHSYGDGPPLIFETMAFAKGRPWDQDCRRYTTEEEALTGHGAFVTELRARLTPWGMVKGRVRQFCDYLTTLVRTVRYLLRRRRE
jgi:hypothetical protein